ncbi:hypothetical protein [Streptomyces sp. NPDC002205]|uniref:hypothetical protein n=1 Tax=Streptomyces sp. NPDC002205 TaxID=3154411 RepID=UPI003332F4D1
MTAPPWPRGATGQGWLRFFGGRRLALRGEQKLTTGHVRLVAEALQMTEWTV